MESKPKYVTEADTVPEAFKQSRERWKQVIQALERAYEFYAKHGDDVDFYRACRALMVAYDSWLD